MIGKGSVATEGSGFKKYWGVAPVRVVAINPTKEEKEKIMGYEQSSDPVYVSTDENGVKTANITFLLQTIEEKCGINMFFTATYFLKNAPMTSQSGKIQVIDEFGRTAWVTNEQLAMHTTTLTKNDGGTYEANITKNYRPMYGRDEEFLCSFIRSWLNIKNPEKYDKITNTWSLIDNASDCQVRLDTVDKMFNGDFSEITSLMKYDCSDNPFQMLVGIQTTDNGKQYHKVFTQFPMKNFVSDYSKLDKEVKEAKARGSYPTTEFPETMGMIKEYTVEPTSFEGTATASLPNFFK